MTKKGYVRCVPKLAEDYQRFEQQQRRTRPDQCSLPAAYSNVFAMAAGTCHSLLLLDAPSASPQLLSPEWTGTSVSLAVPTLYRKNYALEFKNSLADTNWTALPAVGGNGALQMLSDPDAAAPQRFYRLPPGNERV
jgi:hypothetical protein